MIVEADGPISAFSDICGRKSSILVLMFIFFVFSGACGAAQTIEQLISFRALQGIGEAGNYTICMPSPPSCSMSIVYGFSLLLGPILGGAISQSSTWRWIFWQNVPPAALAGLVLAFGLPTGFPYHYERQQQSTDTRLPNKFVWQTICRLNTLGSSILLVATTLLVTALEETNQDYQRVNFYPEKVEPVFPWRFIHNRAFSPQAAVRFIPFTLAAPLGSTLSPAIAKLVKLPLLYLVFFASAIQVVSYALLGTLSESPSISTSQYGYQILAGFGCGINITLLVLMTPFRKRETMVTVAMGAVAQFRVMGGCIGIAVVTAVANGYLQSHLRQVPAPEELCAVLQSAVRLSTLSSADQGLVRRAFSASYNLQMKILAGFAGGQVLASLLKWQQKQSRL
ncbi:major facilitator superfamily domain-containing protein [Aspergillus similis]